MLPWLGFLVVGSDLQSALGNSLVGETVGIGVETAEVAVSAVAALAVVAFPEAVSGEVAFPAAGLAVADFAGGGFGSGGFGGGGFGSGGFGSSSFGGGFNPTDMIRRMDGNGNGTLEPQEMEGRSRYFLERMVPGINLSQTISLEQLIRDVEKARGGSSSGTDTSRSSSSSSTTSSSTTKGNTGAKPLVPAFGVDVAIPTVPGFGDLASGASAPLYAIIDSDRKEADDRIAQYDRNRDGELDKDEIREGRWRDDPFSYDSNGDGRLSKEELAVRYAKRRVEEEKRRQERNGGRTFGKYAAGEAPLAGSSGAVPAWEV